MLQDLAHSVLAGDLDYVKSLLKSNRKLNINIKNLVSTMYLKMYNQSFCDILFGNIFMPPTSKKLRGILVWVCPSSPVQWCPVQSVCDA